MNRIEQILQDAEENGIADEVKEEIEKMNEENQALRHKNHMLQIEKSSSRAEQYRQSNKNLKEKNKKLNEKINKMLKKKQSNLGHLNKDELGVYNRMLTDFEAMQSNRKVTFPEVNHPIFNRFLELANKYPNRSFIVDTLNDKVNEKIHLIDFEIQTQEKNIKIIQDCEKVVKEFPDTWQDEVDEKMAYLYRVTSVGEIEQKIERLEADKVEAKKWYTELKNEIHHKPTNTDVKVKNNLYYEIFNEFDRIYDFCTNVSDIAQYKANIYVNGFTKDELYSSLTRELEKQVGLCEEPYTHNFYYSNGEGRLIPYELNRQFLQYVNKNTTFIKHTKNETKYKSGNIINSKVLFNEVPLYCNKVQYRNPNLVGFNNCFYDVEHNQVIKLNPQIPIMPLKNTKVELYLKEEQEIENNPMQNIFEKCFNEKDRKTILAYLGCALFDKGYTQRQESLFIMGRGGTGKTTFTKAICSIFYNVGHQLVSKFKDSNEFGLSVFADSDVVIIDEIQSAPREFANKLKNISSADDLPVEKKHFDTISIPAENVPRMFLIGNNFSKRLYEESDSEGVNRRILIVIPTMPIQDLGYQWKELIQPSCQQWLVQSAIAEYKAQHLHEKAIPIGSQTISEAEKNERLEMCVYPEQFFVKKHFQICYIENDIIDNGQLIKYSDMFAFIKRCINYNMVESTCKESASNMFIGEVNKALKMPEGHKTRTIDGEYHFVGIEPKTDEAINFLSKEV